ncbi:hypothetical protein C489_09251 [Natrinema versiforme JCM 10478]|uniref:Uncharacterized protein n=1 Tax=Natrinema versiforme JCM 10478 TaxID=1227496 RepID=L9Y117_9EURY|nr:hypothetical protein C489_09251 [Natrinema versiforme JCM 10478]
MALELLGSVFELVERCANRHRERSLLGRRFAVAFADGQFDPVDFDGDDTGFPPVDRDAVDRCLEVVAVAPVDPVDRGSGGGVVIDPLLGGRERFGDLAVDEEFEILVEHRLVLVDRTAEGRVRPVGRCDGRAGGIVGGAEDRLSQFADGDGLGAVHRECVVGVDGRCVSGFQDADDHDAAEQQQDGDQGERNAGTVVVCDRNGMGSVSHGSTSES